MYTRLINSTKSKSFYLFGPRQTGKRTFVRSLIESKDLYIDLLPQRTYIHYAKHPGLLREEILAHAQKNVRFRCIIDETQKLVLIKKNV
ncbi:MAG: hypothetical protein OMM_09069 [Candidatus Magnetoglobus multicellularis str. Araruama]|uniref:AAA domain-containing protein n=1 Tax=Candidatus Magnetoglobus multicellularis str. Araruama TaxID=890399 RepID=A0A1V1P5M0_9BACT|nr:MAG: hypothetical protein OMM_09069 [Candidatus Magnetoglobus multicellularis str. Araruama]